MKTPILFLSIFFSLFAWSAHGQFIFGIKGSFIQSKMDIPRSHTYLGYDDNSKLLNGYGTSLLLYYRINRFLQIGVEPGLAIRGYKQIKYRVPDTNPEVEPYGRNRLYTKYVQAPVFVKGVLPIYKNGLSVFAKGGGGFSRLVSAQNVYTQLLNEQLNEWSAIDLGEATYIERNDFAWQAGAGIEVKLGAGLLSLDAAIYRGTKDFFDYTRSHTRSIEYSLGYQINL